MSKNVQGAFDCLRVIAATSVLFSHSYALVLQDANEPLVVLTNGGTAIREIAVYAFFAISGYLVTQSWMRDPSAIRFMARRALRIVPALAFVIVVSFAIFGPLTTTLTMSDYFSNRQAWTYLSKVLIYPDQYGLPGVFEHNPIPNVVNGSLWSLRLEFALYMIVAVLGYFGLLRWRSVNIALAATCLIMEGVLTQTDFLNSVPFRHQSVVLVLNAVPFFVGAALAQSNLQSRLIWGATVILALSTVLLISTFAFKSLLIVALPLAVILIARFGKCHLTRFGDYSYGIYLFAFPVQQCVIHFIPNIHTIPLSIVASVVTFIFAFLSWHFIEKRALALKPRRKEIVSPPCFKMRNTRPVACPPPQAFPCQLEN